MLLPIVTSTYTFFFTTPGSLETRQYIHELFSRRLDPNQQLMQLTMVTATWKCITEHSDLQRSSHIASVVGHDLYVFGGELVPREPRDNAVYSINFSESTAKVKPAQATSAPSPRVGSASTTLDAKIYIFSGRGGIAMKPIDEQGSLWEYDPSTSQWTNIKPADSSAPFPEARSYHCMASDGKDRIFVHAGCPESGRLADLWAFSCRDRAWKQLADAPPPQRGGTSIALAANRIWRMNGFDGKTEQGGSIDSYDLSSNLWETMKFAVDSVSGPEARSVAALLPLTLGGKKVLVTLFGERDPSSLGHAGAGKMLSDVWMFDIDSGEWTRVETEGPSPPARGWFDADVLDDRHLIVVGGLSESNDRLQDVWELSFN